jgi:hypothetical protein
MAAFVHIALLNNALNRTYSGALLLLFVRRLAQALAAKR